VDPVQWISVGTALVAVSYAAAAHQDLRSREVDDLTWMPTALGVALMAAQCPREERARPVQPQRLLSVVGLKLRVGSSRESRVIGNSHTPRHAPRCAWEPGGNGASPSALKKFPVRRPVLAIRVT